VPSCATTASSSRSPSAKRMGSATSIRPGQLVLTIDALGFPVLRTTFRPMGPTPRQWPRLAPAIDLNRLAKLTYSAVFSEITTPFPASGTMPAIEGSSADPQLPGDVLHNGSWQRLLAVVERDPQIQSHIDS
jgi:hypothetical protein